MRAPNKDIKLDVTKKSRELHGLPRALHQNRDEHSNSKCDFESEFEYEQTKCIGNFLFEYEFEYELGRVCYFVCA